MWPEVEKARLENRHELVLGGADIRRRIDKEGLDPNIFKLTNLNYLDIHDTSCSSIPDEISQLTLLQSLVLHSNELQSINPRVATLSKLKLLDLSRNRLTQVPPELHNLKSIVTFNFANNKIEAFPTLNSTLKLAVLDLSNNKLTQFPDICQLTNLAEIKLNDNEIDAVPPEIGKLGALKVLELGHNKIKSVPGELANCSKLKVLDLQHNLIADRRLKKLIEQCKIKQIVDYIKSHCVKQALEPEPPQKCEVKEEQEQKEYKHVITVHVPNNEIPTVIIDKSLLNIRYSFLGFLIHNVGFTEDVYKKFIQMQNKLHDTVCCKRTIATIATHDFDKLPPGDIQYTTQTPNELVIHPLNRSKQMTGAELFSKLEAEAENLRKEKKRSKTFSGIHKYLSLIEGQARYPCVINAKGVVISFPPITNSEITKIEVGTKTIFVEITSSSGQQTCSKVMNALLKETLLLLGPNLEITSLKQLDERGKEINQVLDGSLGFSEDDVKVVKD